MYFQLNMLLREENKLYSKKESSFVIDRFDFFFATTRDELVLQSRNNQSKVNWKIRKDSRIVEK